MTNPVKVIPSAEKEIFLDEGCDPEPPSISIDTGLIPPQLAA
jgi:hypothetical protein